MTEHEELFKLIKVLREHFSDEVLEERIYACNLGMVRSPITNVTLPMFRRYRNTVSGDPAKLLKDAIEFDG